MDGGFDGQLSTIFAALPPKTARQTLLFSATLSDSIQQLRKLSAEENREHFVWEAKSNTATVAELEQKMVLTPKDAKDAYLVHLIREHFDQEHNEKDLVIVFTKTCKSCQLISMTLNSLGFPAVPLHSMIPQKERSGGLSKFRSRHIKILVATDLASRGLDIPEVQVIINYNVPSVTKDYVHRVGRTARAGRRGKAVTLVTPYDVQLVKAIEELTSTRLSELEIDDDSVAEIHTQVGVTLREQDIKLSEMDFDEKKNINRRKRLLMEGKDPEEEAAKKKRYLRKKEKAAKRLIRKSMSELK